MSHLSGKMSDLENCVCDQNNGECVVSTENFILALPTLTETECFLECSFRKDCHLYTWYSSTHETFQNECLLFRSCDNVESCTQGCFRCKIFRFFLLSFPQNERKIHQFCSVCIFFEGSVFTFQFLNDKIHNYVKKYINLCISLFKN